MRHFIYTYAEHTPRGGHTQKTVRIFRIVRNAPRFICARTDTFVDETQLVIESLEAHKALPAKAFVRNPNGSHKYGSLWSLRDAGIAAIERL